MTVVVGIVDSLGGIIFASDSQNTDGNVKRSDAQKISIVDFANTSILIAESGHSALSGRAVEEMKRLANEQVITSAWEVADIAQKAVQTVRAIMLNGYPQNVSVEDVQRYVSNNCEFNLLLGCILQGEPRLFTIDNTFQIAGRIQRHYASIGAGSELALHLLSEYCDTKQDHFEALASALWIVAKVKASVPGCGGPTQVATLSWDILGLDAKPGQRSEKASIYNPELIRYYEEKLAPLEARSKAERIESIETLFDEIAREAEANVRQED